MKRQEMNVLLPATMMNAYRFTPQMIIGMAKKEGLINGN